ncbi:MAG: double-cubane-cluster-containing anaerobic reductase [Candidatus Loosdrechtia sp.]|uniref:2-hydroxyacyl-CoA dehydratase family protein n=1 Tax=Candidatus Loosdrechtia sp. TaxID=3101272 RepID=UPI003A6D7D7A|nr:MAG: double-cubane-cluster-containing anaerobic reductase [Candidatus Jettenia sp. AMX2]
MEIERFERIKKTTAIHLAMEAKETLKKITDDFPDNPDAMGYFYELFHNLYCNEASSGRDAAGYAASRHDRETQASLPQRQGTPRRERLQGQALQDTHDPRPSRLQPLGTGMPESCKPGTKKIIGTMCLQVPDELICAAGAISLRLCGGAYTYDQRGAEFMPAKSCPLMKATMGTLHTNQALFTDLLSAIVIPTTCDQKKKSVDMLQDMGFTIFPLEMPSVKDTEEARDYWQNSVKKFVLWLEQITGNRITRKSLYDSILKINRSRAEFRRFYNLRKSAPSVIYGKDAFLVANAYFFDDKEQWTDALKRLNNELEDRVSGGISVVNKHAPRILFTGSPAIFPNFKLPLIIEMSGGVVVTDEVCSSSRLLYDSVIFDEANLYDMIPAVADRYLKPCTCPCFVKNEDRKRKLLDMAKGFGIDGVVYQAFSGCYLYEMEHKGIGGALETAGIPVLYIETDYSPEDTGQLTTRVEAFIESIKVRKRRS